MPRRGEGRTITAEGRTLTIIQWATWRGWDILTIRRRLRKGWDPVRAVTEEPRVTERHEGVSRAEVRRERRRVRAEAGLCIHCAHPVEPGKTQCREHLDAAARSMLDLQRTRRELGMCVRCEEPAQPGFSTCIAHGEIDLKAQADRRAHKISIGECTACKRRVVNGHVMCRAHLADKREEWESAGKDRRKEIRAERRAEGLCTQCGERAAANGSALCAEHRKRLREFSRAQIAAKKGVAPKGSEAIRPGVIRRKR